ncbi:hypothetical protein EJP67_25075 [Variovorax guangxiensis]|uniref:Uncharacterized protein n=1 Tax=Variovorax guangxiensis TaxID=1775474 RepID=A0A433MRA4_9BURK|nr:hypothetical protein [Variovorax guangxiensis]MBB4224705.1 hypothetical protein [Variovorax guangxiensis]RUR70332.1 hypothetical protein EJP67_25075 [Variovorax guangxiensis]
MSIPADMQLRLARLSTDLLQMQRAVLELMQECGPQDPEASEHDLIAAAQYRALEAALHAPGAASPSRNEATNEGGELLAWPGFPQPVQRAMRA